MKNAVILLLGPAFLLSCGGQEQAPPASSSDVRIDGAAADNDPESTNAQMCVNEDGHIFVLWIDDRDGQPDIWFNRSLDNGTSWLPTPVMINRGDSNVWAPSMACTTDGVFVVWEDDRDGELQNHQVYFNRSVDGGETWGENDQLLELDDEGHSMSLGPQVTAVGPDVYVAWFDNQNGAYDILVAGSKDLGQTWNDPVRVDSDDPAGSAYSAWPRIAATEAGQVYVVWEDSRDGSSDIYFARSENGGTTFKEDERLDGGDDAGSANSFNPYMSATGNNIYIVWHDERNGQGRDVYLNYSGNGGADWQEVASRVETDNAGFFNSLYPVVLTDGSTGHVAWQDKGPSDTAYDIFYREFAGGVATGEPVRIDTGDEAGFNNSVGTGISMGEGGTVVVAWEDSRGEAESGSDNGYNDLYYNFSEGDGFSDTDYRIDSIAPGQSFKIDLNVAVSGGWIFSSWIDGRNGTSDVYFHALQIGEEATYVEAEGTEAGAR